MTNEKLRKILTEFVDKCSLDLDIVEMLIRRKEDILYGFFTSDIFPEETYRKVAKRIVESKKDDLLMNILHYPTKYTLEAILSSPLDVKLRIIEIAYDTCKCIFEVLNEWRQHLLKDEVIRKLRNHNIDFHEVDYWELEWISKKTGIDINDLEATLSSLDDIYETIWDDLTKCGSISTDQQMIDFFLKLSEDKELDDHHLKMINEIIQLMKWIRQHGLSILPPPKVVDLDLNDLLKDDS